MSFRFLLFFSLIINTNFLFFHNYVPLLEDPLVLGILRVAFEVSGDFQVPMHIVKFLEIICLTFWFGIYIHSAEVYKP